MINEPQIYVSKEMHALDRVRLGDLKSPSVLGFQILSFIETEVKVKSSIGPPS